jgi:hypothetical protein
MNVVVRHPLQHFHSKHTTAKEMIIRSEFAESLTTFTGTSAL